MSTDKTFEEGAAGTKAGRKSDPTKEYESNEPMSLAKISEHEPTAVKRENTSSTGSSSTEEAKEKLRRSGMTEGTAGSTNTGNEYEQGATGTNK
ncbi:MAG TPA: hypothetical protein VH500_25070 [Nitrososphaeraceae archaeon]|jgi:hypothetical protein